VEPRRPEAAVTDQDFFVEFSELAGSPLESSKWDNINRSTKGWFLGSIAKYGHNRGYLGLIEMPIFS
jgi:hypothetical protein